MLIRLPKIIYNNETGRYSIRKRRYLFFGSWLYYCWFGEWKPLDKIVGPESQWTIDSVKNIYKDIFKFKNKLPISKYTHDALRQKEHDL